MNMQTLKKYNDKMSGYKDIEPVRISPNTDYDGTNDDRINRTRE